MTVSTGGFFPPHVQTHSTIITSGESTFIDHGIQTTHLDGHSDKPEIKVFSFQSISFSHQSSQLWSLPSTMFWEHHFPWDSSSLGVWEYYLFKFCGGVGAGG